MGVAAIAVTLSAIAGAFVATQPATATTGALTTAATYQPLAAATNAQAFPSGKSNAVVSINTPDTLVAQAASLAAGLGVPLVLTSSGTSTSTALADLQALGATHVSVFGTSSTFSAAFLSSLSSRVTIDVNIAESNAFERSKVLAQRLVSVHPVVVDPSVAADVRVGANYAAMNGFPLIYVDGTETSANLSTFFSNFASGSISVIGKARSVTSSIPSAQTGQVEVLNTDDPDELEVQLADRTVGAGNSATDVYVAPSDQLGSVSLAGLWAHNKGGVSLSAGAATNPGSASAFHSYASLWASELSTIHLVGKSLSNDSLVAVSQPTTVARASAPSWHLIDTTLGSATWTISYTSLGGASSYVAYDVYGESLGTSTTGSMTLAGTPSAVALVALNSSGDELARIEYRVNKFEAADERESAVIVGARAGTNYLRFLGTLKVPRLITRTMTDPFDESAEPVVVTNAITCMAFFADSGLDPTKQYRYTVQTLSSSDNRGCSSTAPQNPVVTAPVSAAAVTVPLTEFPASPEGMGLFKAGASADERAASPTTTDSALMQSQNHTTVKSRQVTAKKGGTLNRATFPDFVLRYQGFIAQQYVPFPESTGDLLRPVTAFGGDNRGGGISYGSYRFRMTVFFNFAGRTVNMVPEIGESHKFKCTVLLTGCIQTASASAPTSSLTMPYASITSNQALVRLNVDSSLPLVSFAPPINGNINFYLGVGNSTILGTHDMMPNHEIFSGLAYSEYSTNYVSRWAVLPCLYGGPGCVVQLNQGF